MALLVGLAVTNRAVARAWAERGEADVIAVDDRPTAAMGEMARQLGIELVGGPSPADLDRLVAGAEVVLPSPGVPDHHPVFALARRRGVPIRSEFDLARVWDDRPVVAITGTDGKTTVTTMVEAMLNASGVRAFAAGNLEVPLVAAIDDPSTEVFVVEASSFRLDHTERFEPAVATWLNFAPDHQDAHASLAGYESAKARIWRDQPAGAVAIGNADDPVVAHHLARARAHRVGFGLREGDYRLVGDGLVTPAGEVLARVGELWRSFPHDVANGLAASATALCAGGHVSGVREALLGFRGLPHRVSLVGEAEGVRYYDDSKATAPHATIAAVRAFESVVLIAGGRNKGLDLTVLTEEAARIRGVVAIGEASGDVERAFAGVRPVVVGGSMAEAVEKAAAMAGPGDAVLLSPACASFDWYSSYAERGDDFARCVRQLTGSAP